MPPEADVFSAGDPSAPIDLNGSPNATSSVLTRRRWFSTIARNTVLVGLAGLVGSLALRRRDGSDGHACYALQSCRDCRSWTNCQQPAAQEARKQNY